MYPLVLIIRPSHNYAIHIPGSYFDARNLWRIIKQLDTAYGIYKVLYQLTFIIYSYEVFNLNEALCGRKSESTASLGFWKLQPSFYVIIFMRNFV